jgi:uncharacterized protein YggE
MEQETIKFLSRGIMLLQILIVGVLVFFVGQLLLQNKSINQQDQNQITVSGEGKVYAKPDVAIISLGVTSQAATVASVTINNTDKMNTVIDAVKKLGVADKDIQTTNYSLTPVYANNYIVPTPAPLIYSSSAGSVSSGTMIRTGSTLTGYKLEQDVQVKIRDFTKVGDILSGATTSGANVVGDLQFTIDNPQQFEDQARALAIAQAKINAQNLAKESGIGLGKIINVIEGYSPSPVMYSNAIAGGGIAAAVPAVPTVQPGQQEIDVTINLTYQVK